MTSLSADKIFGNINDEELKRKISLHVFQEIDSTNSFLKTLNDQNYLTVCTAEQQTKGRGRLGNDWFSPYGENIYLSLRWLINEPVNKLNELSLVVGISVVNVLKAIGIDKDIKIKWPNDIYYKDKKLSGILTEITHHSNRTISKLTTTNEIQEDSSSKSTQPSTFRDISNNFISVIIGIGININSDFTNLNHANWTSLYNISNKKYDRNIIIAKLVTTIQNDLQKFLANGFEMFAKLWREHDYLYKKNIFVTHIDNRIQGIAAGINTLGELRLICKNGEIISLKSGEASILRPLP